MDGTQSAAEALAAVGCNCAFGCGKRPATGDAGTAPWGGVPELDGARLIAEIRTLEDRKSALAARQARLSVAFDLLQRREQADAGMPADGAGRRDRRADRAGPAGIAGPRRPAPGPGESPRHRDAPHPRRAGGRGTERMAREPAREGNGLPVRGGPGRRRRRTRPRHRNLRRRRGPENHCRGADRRVPAGPAFRHPAGQPCRHRTARQPPPGPGHHVLPHRPAPRRPGGRRARRPHPARRHRPLRRGPPDTRAAHGRRPG